MADLLFGLDLTKHLAATPWSEVCNLLAIEWLQTSTRSARVDSTKAKQLNPNKINRRSAIQWYVPLRYSLL